MKKPSQPSPLPQEQPLPEQRQAFYGRLWQLLAEQTQAYTRGESSSVRVETARELTASLSYTLSLAAQAAGLSPRELAGAELLPLLQQGQRLLAQELADCRELWQQVCLSAPAVDNVYYQSTLQAIGCWFSRYDLCFMAHLPAANIDYPLLSPISEALPGLSYVTAWLEQLQRENRLLACFAPTRVKALLRAAAGDYAQGYLNLCEQPLVNALGLVLSGREGRELEISPSARQEITALLQAAGPRELRPRLQQAAGALGRQLGLEDRDPALSCLRQLARDIVPRLNAALEAGDLSQVFI